MATFFHTEIRKPPYFQWIMERQLAAFAFPSKSAHIRYLVNANIVHLVSLQAYPNPPIDGLPQIKWTKIDIEEFGPPTLEQCYQFVDLVETAFDNNEAVGVHCTFGRGRTGTMIACFFVKSLEMSAEAAIDKIRAIRPYTVETEEQEEAVFVFEESLRSAHLTDDQKSSDDAQGSTPTEDQIFDCDGVNYKLV